MSSQTLTTPDVSATTLLSVPTERGVLSLILPEMWLAYTQAVEWEWKSAARTEKGTAETLAHIPAWALNSRVLVWSPARDTRFVRVRLPAATTRAKIEQALPFVLEEELLDEPETLNFAYATVGEDLVVAITARAQIKEWLSALHAAHLTPAVLCPKTLRLPLEENTWTVWFSQNDCFIRSGPWDGFACETSPDAPDALLNAAVNEARQAQKLPTQILVYNPPSGFRQAVWRERLGVPIRGVTPTSASFVADEPALNVLQGDWAPAAVWYRAWLPFRSTLIVLGLWIATGFLFNVWQCVHLSWLQKKQHAQMVSLFRQTFPEAKAIVDPALQMERNLLALKTQSGQLSNSDFLALLTALAPSLRGTPDIHLRSLQYDENGLIVEVLSPDFKALEVLKTHWSSNARRVEVLSAENREGHVEGRLQIHTENS